MHVAPHPTLENLDMLTTSTINGSNSQYVANGIRVERYTPPTATVSKATPIICVHGGLHGSWCFAEHARAYANAGYDVHALNWLGRGGSDDVATERFVKLSISDVVDDIVRVSAGLETAPVLVAHSMGGLAAQLYATHHPVRALVLLTPVVPANLGAEPIELPIGDPALPWQPPPPPMATQLFFQGLDADEAVRLHALLVPESPRRVLEATRYTLTVEADKVIAPTLIVSGTRDRLVPPPLGRLLADLYGADHREEAQHGHNVLLGPGAARIAGDIVNWLNNKGVV